ncbi:unnamed protein product [Nippostrongylus brasiliensis]|uniref:C3HC-type domain-containing protein n=1 Tax=Nippostrongylus brasiliensis TaxID=27835 RepID=A0A0N4Y420_NIPBR|nr:unnamed protein product [Nippostrongylus brasiliensis]
MFMNHWYTLKSSGLSDLFSHSQPADLVDTFEDESFSRPLSVIPFVCVVCVMTVAGWNWDAAKKAQKERELLTCCYCNAPLEAIMLDTNPRTGEQRFFWACRRTRKDACKFPVGMPPEVFFLKRTAAEKEAGDSTQQYLPTKANLLPPAPEVVLLCLPDLLKCLPVVHTRRLPQTPP